MGWIRWKATKTTNFGEFQVGLRLSAKIDPFQLNRIGFAETVKFWSKPETLLESSIGIWMWQVIIIDLMSLELSFQKL